MSNPLYKIGEMEINGDDFTKAFKEMGVAKDDVLFVHSDVSVFGFLGRKDRDYLLSSLVDAVKAAVPQGTIIMPTFSYSFCKEEVYDIEETKSTVGALTEFFRGLSDVQRTRHPIFSVGVWGKDKEYFLDVGKDSFDKDSIFGKIHGKKAKIVFLGAPFQSCTFIHYIEQMHGVPYRFIKTFKGTIKDKGKTCEDKCTYLVRYLDEREVTVDLGRFKDYLIKNNHMRAMKLGNGRIMVVGAETLFDKGMRLLGKDINYFLQ